MELNKILFPAPKTSYTPEGLYGELMYIPRGGQTEDHVPVLYLPYNKGASKLLLYFHGNAEDLGLAYDMLDHIRITLRVSFII